MTVQAAKQQHADIQQARTEERREPDIMFEPTAMYSLTPSGEKFTGER